MSILDNFTWQAHEAASGRSGAKEIFIKYTPQTMAKKDNAKIVFTITSLLGVEFGLPDTAKLAFSFDNREVLMAINAPDTIPHFTVKGSKGKSWVFANKRLLQTIVDTVGFEATELVTKGGIYIISLNHELIDTEGDVKVFRLTKDRSQMSENKPNKLKQNK